MTPDQCSHLDFGTDFIISNYMHNVCYRTLTHPEIEINLRKIDFGTEFLTNGDFRCSLCCNSVSRFLIQKPAIVVWQSTSIFYNTLSTSNIYGR